MGKNVEVVTKISSSRASTARSMAYADQRKPHDSDNGQVKRRVLAKDAINCSTDKHLAEMQFKHLARATADAIGGKNRNRSVQSILEIKSFRGLSYHEPNDWNTAIRLNHQMMRKEHPNSMVISFLQADGVSHHLHIHNIISPIDMKTGKSTTHRETSWNRAVRISNQVMKNNGYQVTYGNQPIKQPTQNGSIYYKYHGAKEQKSLGAIYAERKTGHSEYSLVQRALRDSFTQAHNLPQAIQIMNHKYHYGVSLLAHHTVNGQSKVRKYKTPSKDPARNVQFTDGSFGRLRKTWAFGNLKTGFKIRTSKLGSDYSPRNLIKALHTNRPILIQAYLQHIQHRPNLQTTGKKTQPKMSYYNTTLPNGQRELAPKLYRIIHKVPRKKAIHMIRKHYPNFPELVPKKIPKPIKPNVSVQQGMHQLISALNMSKNTVNQQEQRMLAINQAMENYREEQKKQALEYGEYQAGLDFCKQQREDQAQAASEYNDSLRERIEQSENQTTFQRRPNNDGFEWS